MGYCFRDRRIDRNEVCQPQGFQGMPNHRGRSYDTETHLIDMQGVVPRKEVAHSTKIHAGHVGKIKDDMVTGPLLGLRNNVFKPQVAKRIHMSRKRQSFGGWMIRDVEVQHEGFIGKKGERVKCLFGKDNSWKAGKP